MAIGFPGLLQQSNNTQPIVDSNDVYGGLKQIGTFSNTGLSSSFGTQISKFKIGTSLVDTSTNIIYYLTSPNPLFTSSWSKFDPGIILPSNQIAYGNTASGLTSSSNFTYDPLINSVLVPHLVINDLALAGNLVLYTDIFGNVGATSVGVLPLGEIGYGSGTSIISSPNFTIDTAYNSSIIGGTGQYNDGVYNSIVGGGSNNTIENYSDNSGIIGGQNNIIDENSTESAIIGGDGNNIINSGGVSIIGGQKNIVINSNFGGIFNGINNHIDSSTYSAIIGGEGLSLTGQPNTLLTQHLKLNDVSGSGLQYLYTDNDGNIGGTAIGPQGFQGPTGPQGTNGVFGPQGITGPIGAQGATGAQGIGGAQGIQGVTGPQGFQGPTGPQGSTGTSSTIAIVTDNTLVETQSGLTYSLVLNLTASNIWTSATTSFLGGKVVHTINNLGNTYSQGIIIQNLTAATASATLQVSPSLRFSGNALSSINYNNTADIYLTSNSAATAILNFDLKGNVSSSPTTQLQLIQNNGNGWVNIPSGGLAIGSPAAPQYTTLGISYTSYIIYKATPTAVATPAVINSCHIFGQNSPFTSNSNASVFMNLSPVYNQVGGTNSNYDLWINRSETSVNGGTQRFISAGIGTSGTYSEYFGVDNKGTVISTMNNLSTGVTAGLILQNITPATATSSVQYSPYQYLSGQVWNTASSSNSTYISRTGVIAVSSTSPLVTQNFDISNNNGASWFNVLSLQNNSSTALSLVGGNGVLLAGGVNSSSNILNLFGGPLGSGGSVLMGPASTVTTSASTIAVTIQNTLNVSGTAGSIDLLIKRTQIQIGSGLQRYISSQNGGTESFGVDNTGCAISTINNLGASVSAGLILQNNTLSSSSIPFQNAPSIWFSGHGSQSGADKQIIHRIRSASQDVNGGNTGTFLVDNSIDGGATFQTLLSISRQNQILLVGSNGGGGINASSITYASGAGGSGTFGIGGIFSGSGGFLTGFGTALSIGLGGTNQNTSTLTQSYVNANVYTKYNQASGAASNYDFIVTRSGTVGSGRQILISAGPSTTTGTYSEVFAIDINGKINQPYGGSKPVIGTASLVSGVSTVTTGAVTSNSIIWLQYYNTSGISIGVGNLSNLVIQSISNGASFVVNALTLTGATNITDNSVIQWHIYN